MKYRRLGRTCLMVSEVGFGAWAIGGGHNLEGNPIGYGPTDDQESMRAIEKALECGITLIDTADAYGAGRSETLIGKVLKGKWNKIYLATKVGNQRRDPLASVKNFSRDYVLQAAAASLKRLQKDVIDLYQLHNPSLEVVRNGEIFETLEMLKKKGLVRFIGVSVSDPDEGVELIESNLVDTIQVVYHFFNQKAAEKLFPLALQKNVGIIVREPLANGILTGKFTPDTTFPDTDHRSRTYPPDKLKVALEKVEKLRFLANNRTMAQAALKFILSQGAVSAVIPGAKRPAQVVDNAAASGEPLSQLELEKVRELLAE